MFYVLGGLLVGGFSFLAGYSVLIIVMQGHLFRGRGLVRGSLVGGKSAPSTVKSWLRVHA
jgi:hypothetical protein